MSQRIVFHMFWNLGPSPFETFSGTEDCQTHREVLRGHTLGRPQIHGRRVPYADVDAVDVRNDYDVLGLRRRVRRDEGQEGAAVIRVGQHEGLYTREVFRGREFSQERVVEGLQNEQAFQAGGGEAREDVVSQIPGTKAGTLAITPKKGTYKSWMFEMCRNASGWM